MKKDFLSGTIRRVATKIGNSKNPSRLLVAAELKRIMAFAADQLMAEFTDDGSMGSNSPNFTPTDEASVLQYLASSPRHAVIVQSVSGEAVAVFRGASDEPTNFFIQALPLEDMNDADGGEWTAEEALQEALSY